MRVVLALVVSLSISACKFERNAVPGFDDDPSTAAGRKDGGREPTRDAGGGSGSGGSGSDAQVDGSAPPSTRDDAGTPHVRDGGADVDADTVPPPPDAGPQVGGLKCGDVFCPFATAPLEPCCTRAGDAERGTARAEDRCGVNFGATGSDYFADYCWQRDQPGVVDDGCPAVSVDLRTEEPGCCTEQGVCGGLDSEHALGCHLDPYATERRSCGGATVDGGTEPACDLRGLYALRMTVDLVWGGRSGGLWDSTDDGRGTLVIDMLAELTDVDTSTLEIQGVVTPCGVELPPFYSTTLCEAYQPIFPDGMWESEVMPKFPVSGRLSCAAPGCIASLEAQTVLLGIELDNPESPWPTAAQTPDLSCDSGEGADCFPDHDGDRRPGLTVHLEKRGTIGGGIGCGGSGYRLRGAPLRSSIAAIFGGVRRADRILLGVRMRVGGSFELEGEACTTGAGSGVAEFVNSRAWGCLVQPGTFDYPNGSRAGPNEPCTAQQAAFMDANLPIYDILALGERPPSNLELAETSASEGPRVSLIRLAAPGERVSCADVREAPHP